MTMELIGDAKNAWKYLSVQIPLVSGGLVATYMVLPDNLRAEIPASWFHTAILIAFLSGGLGRFLKQSGSTPGSDAGTVQGTLGGNSSTTTQG